MSKKSLTSKILCTGTKLSSLSFQVRELQLAYECEVRRLAGERQHSLQSILALPWLQQPIDHYYQVSRFLHQYISALIL